MAEENKQEIVAVLGATGQQGGGTLKALLKLGGFRVRAITRNADSDSAKALAADDNVEVVAGDVDDVESLTKALTGATALFSVTNFWAHMSVDRERKQLENVANAAKAAGTIKHIVVSTLEDTRPFGKDFKLLHGYSVPHFDVKGECNKLFEDTGIPTAFLYTAFYYQNFIYFAPPGANGDGTFSITMPMGQARLGMVDSQDIGRAAAELFKRKATGHHGVLGASLKVDEIAAILSKELGKTIKYNEVPTEVFAGFGFPGADDMANMYRYYRDFAEQFDKYRTVEKSNEYITGGVKPFDEWVRENKEALLSKLQ